MVREGLFSDVDAVLSWHPDDENAASAKSSLANRSAKGIRKSIPVAAVVR
jgi:aminobenzoyl-glutamate utilization protein B